MENTEKVAILVRMPQDLKEKLEKAAEADNRSVTNYIVTLLRREFEREEAASTHVDKQREK